MEREPTAPPKQTSPLSEESDSDDALEPRAEIDQFDWEKLEADYLEAMATCKAEEDSHLQTFESLSQYFAAWAGALSGHEQERSHKRLVTQSVLVKKQEADLEEQRKHYVKVVEAFQAALNLLK